MVSVEAYSELLQVLYSAPLQQELWQRFLTRVCESTNSSLGVFIAADTGTGLAVLASGGTRDNSATISSYNSQYAQSDPFRPAIIHRCRARNPVGVYTEEELIPEATFMQTPIYRGLLGPADLRHGAITILACTLRRLDVVSLWRTPAEGPIYAAGRQLMELLIPHVQIALKIRRALGAADERIADAEAMANASRTATFVLTRDGHVQHWNTAAAALLCDESILAVRNGRLTGGNAQASASLARLFEDAVSPSYSISAPKTHHVLSLRRESDNRSLQLLVTSLPESHRARSQADLLLMVSDPEKPACFPDDILHTLYGLTPAETEVANGLLMGYSAEEIGCLRRVSTSTVRQQIKSMLSKTGTSRQSDMVRLFMTLPQVPLRMA
jgi:DNA-binding CsgD family transcriptional regulator/PAS domain-containing protein